MPFVALDDVEIFYESLGSGPPVVFLHSHYSRGVIAFESQVGAVAGNYSCYLPDLRGHGKTTSRSLTWSTPQIADDVIILLDRLGLVSAHFVGYSMGANVALTLAVGAPDRVATLTTIGTDGRCLADGSDDFEPDALLAAGEHEFIASMTERHMLAHGGDCDTFLRQTVADWRQHPQLTDAQIASITAPALFITGEHDPYSGAAGVQRLSALVAGSRTLVVPGGSHRPHMAHEEPGLVNDAILGHLGAHPPSSS